MHCRDYRSKLYKSKPPCNHSTDIKLLNVLSIILGIVYVTLYVKFITKEKYIPHYPITTGTEALSFNLVHYTACENCSLSHSISWPEMNTESDWKRCKCHVSLSLIIYIRKCRYGLQCILITLMPCMNKLNTLLIASG